MAKKRASPAADNKASIARRTLLQGAPFMAASAWGAASAQTGASTVAAGPRSPARNDRTIARADTGVVETHYGKVAGYVRNGIFAFKGLPYGATTAGENRFRAPQKPAPWSSVRSSRNYGAVCPQDKGTGRFNDEEGFIFQWSDSVESEDCLRLNVWTPAINDNARRPVMVWLHGGGFAAGSGHDLPAFDGENLARRGDVVVITLNHRLNSLGFLDVSEFGEQYSQSGNVGMLDIVAALEWVRDNIDAFGGDPQRVLIFGQSGGGGKVSALMGMPAARGLFHRAVVQSGSFTLTNTLEKSRRIGDLIVAELGLSRANVAQLQATPYLDLRRASEAVFRRENAPTTGFIDVRRFASSLSFAPVADGIVLPARPFDPAAPSVSGDVPMIIGTTLNEFTTGINHPEYEQMTEADLNAKAASMFPHRPERVVAAFRRRTPQAIPFDLWSRIATAPIRQAALTQAAAKAALGAAPAYVYLFAWRTPILDGRPRAFHCADIPFAFYNTDRCENMTGGGERARELGARMADALIAFARTGSPNHAAIPQWQPYAQRSSPTMIFDDAVSLAVGFDAEEQASIAAA